MSPQNRPARSAGTGPVRRPQRIQRRRAKGWQMPEGAVYVGRDSKWGNPFVVGVDGTRAFCLWHYRALAHGYLCISMAADHVRRQEAAKRAMKDARTELRGKDLACWCPLVDGDGQRVPCHADILIEIANNDIRKD